MDYLIKLKYKEKEYQFTLDLNDDEGVADYQATEGNQSCDCNKSLYIQRYCDPSFPEMDCGDEIQLVSMSRAE